MTDRLDEIGIKLSTGQAITHEDAADLFELTMVGAATMRANRLTRADMLARLRGKYPDAADLTKFCRDMMNVFDAMARQKKH